LLDLSTILALSHACAPQVAPETLAAVAYAESRFDPLAIGVNRGPRPVRRARDAAEATRIARNLIARGGNLDLGIAQINSANLGWLRLTVEDAFDPCRNLRAAATVLRAGYRPHGPSASARQAALRTALSRYNTGDPERGFRNGYVARVEDAARRLALVVADDADGLPVPAPTAAPTPSPSPARPPAPPWDIFARADTGAVTTFPITIRTPTP